MRTLLLASTLFLAATAVQAQTARQPAQPTPATAAASAILTPERVFANPSLAGPVARGVSLSPDGELVAFLRSREDDVDVLDLWAAPVSGGEPFKLIDARALVPEAGQLSEAEIARRERMRISQRGVVEYSWDEQGRYILAPLEGDIFLADRQGGAVRRLTETAADEIDAKVSPKGSYVSFVRDQNLFVIDLATGQETAITDDGKDLITWATAEFIAQEELDRDTGYWWSPNERYIAIQRTDESPVDVIPRLDITGGGASVIEQRYPRAGRPNAVVELYIRDIQSGDRVKVDLGDNTDIYLGRVNWAADGQTAYVQRLSRDQKRLDLLAVDPATGRSRVIASQTSRAWVNVTHDFRALRDGNFIWSSEESGWRHLYLYNREGRRLRPITRGDYAVKSLNGVNQDTGEVFFTASMRDGREYPIEQQLFRASLRRTGDATAVTPQGGWWSASVNGTGTAYVGNYSDLETPPQSALYSMDGTRVRWIEENRLEAGHPFWPYASRKRTPEYGTLQSHGETLVWQMVTPPDFDPSKTYPVVMQVYGGPSGGGVRRAWQPASTQLLTEAGYIVFRLDNRGEGDRSAAFKQALYLKMGQPEIEDQVVGANYLRSLPYVDANRIAMMGWSYGGFMSLMALTEPKMGLASAIAGAPPTEWGLYDTGYTERYMSTPERNVDGYAASDVNTRLDNLTGRLLLMHGMADDNVIFENTTRVLNALQERSIPFETMLYPGQRHGIRGNDRQLHQWGTYLDFLDRTIGSRAPAAE
ncbi:S9 family peptidase [Brevundimonas sp. S30B]|uniref:S9 family peptidase n=1 Tax=unclassified Brevundimonas TaxID=2622653 RepID=UPI0010725B33|nr:MULTISPECIES: S9 family peptidase [unclassified Brevundimonas]QBX38315.1 S9 family peptidase [Brevundimonas sp. MF30-B]TFW01548.1 S9 family peptidase [Brevundimonas sp. S30B]